METDEKSLSDYSEKKALSRKILENSSEENKISYSDILELGEEYDERNLRDFCTTLVRKDIISISEFAKEEQIYEVDEERMKEVID